MVSHDRWFLEHVANRMFDLDPVHAGGFFETRGRYSEFLERKDAALREQARWQETLANRVRRELDWLRHGPKARTTKAQARIDEAGRLSDELAAVQDRRDRRIAAIDFDAPRAPHQAPGGGRARRQALRRAARSSTTSTWCSVPAPGSACSARTAAASRR